MQPNHRYLSNLTPLRGIAALWVVVFHFSLYYKITNPLNSYIITKGYIMVDLFFIMSGFIIYHVYREKFQYGLDSKNLKNFIVARFARIYPLHFFTLALSVALFVPKWGWDRFDSPTAIITNVLMVHTFGFHDALSWNFPSWSISAEWWSYLIFPFVAIFLYRRKQLAVLVLPVLIFLSYMGIVYWIHRMSLDDPKLPAKHNMDSTFDFGYLRGMAGFVTGMLVYRFYLSGYMQKIFQKDITAIGVILITIIALHFNFNDIGCIVLFALLVFTFAQSNQFLHKICNNRLAQYLGNISYSIYLMQMFIMVPIWFFDIKLPGITYPKDAQPFLSFSVWSGYCLVNLILLVGLSSLTYYGIEKPCRKWINAKWGKQQMPVYA